MSSLISSAETAATLQSLTSELPHAILLTGQIGVGLATAAREIAGKSLEDILMPTDRDGAIDASPKGIIRAKQIRQLVEQAATKARTRRVYIIDNADQMNATAQNAFLKLLEEPVAHTHFILTSHAPHKLLPTVRSRVQATTIQSISDSQSTRLLTSLGITDATARAQMLFLANGLAAELTRLATDKNYFAHESAYIRDARAFLQGSPVEQVTTIERYQKSREDSLGLLASAQRILSHSLRTQPSRELVARAETLATAYDRIAANGNIRLQLMVCVV